MTEVKTEDGKTITSVYSTTSTIITKVPVTVVAKPTITSVATREVFRIPLDFNCFASQANILS